MQEAILHKLNELVRPDEISQRFPDIPHPKRITILETVDHTAEEAYDVVVVYPDSTPDVPLNKLAPMVDWIREEILKRREGNRWPYFWFRHESDARPSTRRLRG